MTGTAETEADEFAKIYKLDVIVRRPTVRFNASRNLTRCSGPTRKGRSDRHRHRG